MTLKDQNYKGFKIYFKNTMWLFFQRIFQMVMSFFIIIAITRYLGPEKFGLLAYAQSFVGIFVAFSTLGIDVILVRELIRHKECSSRFIGTAFFLKLIVSVISIVVILVLNLLTVSSQNSLLVLIISLTLFFQCFNTIDCYFQARIISKYSALISTIAFAISSLVKLFLVFIGAKLICFAYALVLDSLLLALGYIYIYIAHENSLFNWVFDRGVAINLLKSGWPLTVVSVAAFVYTRIDQVMLEYMVGNVAVGNYAAASKIGELFYFIPLLISQSVFPKIIEMKSYSEKEYFEVLEKLYRLVVWSSIPIAIGLFVFRNQIVFVLYGHEFIQAGTVLSVLSFGIVFNAIGTITTKVLYVEHYE